MNIDFNELRENTYTILLIIIVLAASSSCIAMPRFAYHKLEVEKQQTQQVIDLGKKLVDHWTTAPAPKQETPRHQRKE